MKMLRVALVLGALLVATTSVASAAKKVIDEKQVNESIPLVDVFGTLPSEICGVTGPFAGDLVINVFHFTLWDNGHSVLRSSDSVRLVDSDGNPVLKDLLSQHEVDGPSSLPQSVGVQLTSHCHGTTPTPGKVYQSYITFTVGEDGTLKQVHGEFCDPAYPFCG